MPTIIAISLSIIKSCCSSVPVSCPTTYSIAKKCPKLFMLTQMINPRSIRLSRYRIHDWQEMRPSIVSCQIIIFQIYSAIQQRNNCICADQHNASVHMYNLFLPSFSLTTQKWLFRHTYFIYSTFPYTFFSYLFFTINQITIIIPQKIMLGYKWSNNP